MLLIKAILEHFAKTPKMNHHCDWQANVKPTGWLVTACFLSLLLAWFKRIRWWFILGGVLPSPCPERSQDRFAHATRDGLIQVFATVRLCCCTCQWTFSFAGTCLCRAVIHILAMWLISFGLLYYFVPQDFVMTIIFCYDVDQYLSIVTIPVLYNIVIFLGVILNNILSIFHFHDRCLIMYL